MASSATSTANNSASPRCSQSPLLRRKRDAAVANQQCVQVQWRFLQHQNPVPPSFKGGAKAPSATQRQLSPAAPPPSQSASQCESPSKLYELFASPQAEAEINEEHRRHHDSQLQQQQQQQQKRAQRQCRVLDDILGETQRKAMLNRIMADMEALALQSDAKPQRRKRADGGGAADAARRRDGDSKVAASAKHSDGIMALRNSLSHSPALGVNAITLLPQRRLSALGSVEVEEPMAEAPLHESDGDDEDDGDDDGDDDDGEEDDNDGSGERTRGDRVGGGTSRPHQRTAESIAMAELRKVRRRHQRRQQRLGARDPSSEHRRSGADSHVFWQKSSRVKLAYDIPQALLVPTQLVNATAAQMIRQPSSRLAGCLSVGTSAAHEAAAASAASSSDEQQSFSNLVKRRRRPFLSPTDSAHSVMSESQRGERSNTSPRATIPGEPAASSPPLSPVVSPRDARKLQAPYGAWYLPRQQWWELHTKERQALAERFPAEARATAAAATQDERHCHHAAQQERCHKPPVASPTAAGGSGVTMAGAPVSMAPRGSAGGDESSRHDAWPSTLRRQEARQ